MLRPGAAGRRRNWREHRDVRFVEVGEDADAGEGILAPRDGCSAFGADGGDVALNETVLERCGGAARRFNLLKELPGRAAKLTGQIFNRTGTRGRIGDLGEVRFLKEDELGVARDAARKWVGQTASGGERQDGDRIGAAEGGRDHGDGGAQDVHVRVARGERAPRRFRRDERRRGREPAGNLDARPQFPQRAEFRHGEELIRIGAESEKERAPCCIERDASRLERAQIGGRDREHESQFLRLGAAGIVDHAAVGRGLRAGKTFAGQGNKAPGKMRRLFVPAPRRAPRHRHGAERIASDAKVARRRRRDPSVGECRVDDGFGLRRQVKLDGNAGDEVDTLEDASERALIRRQPEPVVADRAGEHEREAAGAVLKLVQRRGVRFGRIGVVDARERLPGRGPPPSGARLRVGAARGKRLDGEAVIGRAAQPLERCALEHGVDELAPVLPRRRSKIRGKRRIFAISHRFRIPRGSE